MSWAEDEGIDGLLDEEDASFQYALNDEDRWVNGEGENEWDDLETSHIAAIIRGLRNGKWPRQAHKLGRALEELKQRKAEEKDDGGW